MTTDEGLETTPDIGFAKESQLDPSTTVLMVIDMTYGNAHSDYGLCEMCRQNGIDTSYYVDRLEQLVIPAIKKVTKAARDAGIKVIYFQNGAELEDYSDVHKNLRPVYQLWQQRRGKPGFEIREEIRPEEGDLVLTKIASGAWAGTNIDNILRFRKVEHVIATGVATNGCVLTTALGGWDKGFFFTIVEDATATTGQRVHEQAIEVMRDYGMPISSGDEIVRTIAESVTPENA